MKYKKSLKEVSFIFFLGIYLIFIGFLIYFLNKKTTFTYAKVTRVIDGDSLVIDTDQQVRLVGMDTPEYSKCYWQAAKKITENLVLGKVVKLEKDISDVDKYGRLLRFVYVDDIFVDDYLVKNGAAKIMTVPPNTKYKNEFSESQKYAKENKLGLWGKCQ